MVLRLLQLAYNPVMTDKTRKQVNEELDQHLAAIEKLQLDIEAHKTAVRDLVQDRDSLEKGPLEALGIMRAPVTARDGIPVVSRAARAKPVTEGPTIKDMRAWAADTGWTVPFGEHKGKQVGEWKNRLPNEVKSVLTDDYNKAN